MTETTTLGLSLSRTVLIGATGYTFTVTGLSEDQLNRGHFVHSIVGLEDQPFDYLPAHAAGRGLPLGTQKFVQTGWFGGFAQLPVGTHTHRLEAWLEPGQTDPVVIEQQITVQSALEYFNALDLVYYLDLTQTDREADWPGVPAGTAVSRKLNTMSLVSDALAVKKKGAMLLVRGSCPGFEFNPRGKTYGLYLTSYDGRATITGGLSGVTEGDFTNLRPFMTIEGIDFRGQGDVINGRGEANPGSIKNGVRNGTVVSSITYAGITVENLTGVYPSGTMKQDAELVVFNSKITSWMDIGLYVLGKAAICGNYICQNPLAVNGVEGKLSGAGNFPDHGCMRAPYGFPLAFNKNMAFSCNGWSAGYSAVGHPIMAHQPCLRVNTSGSEGLRACIMGNFFEGMAATLGKGASSASNYPAEILTFRHNILMATAANSSMIHLGTTNVFLADNLFIIPEVTPFTGNKMQAVGFGLSTQAKGGGKALIDATMYEGQIWIRGNTFLDLRRKITDSTNMVIGATVAKLANAGIAVEAQDNALFIPNRAPSDVGAPVMADADVEMVQSSLVPQFWGLRQRYTVTERNDTADLNPSYATPADAVKIPVPEAGSALLRTAELSTAQTTIADLFGNRKKQPIKGAVVEATPLLGALPPAAGEVAFKAAYLLKKEGVGACGNLLFATTFLWSGQDFTGSAGTSRILDIKPAGSGLNTVTVHFSSSNYGVLYVRREGGGIIAQHNWFPSLTTRATAAAPRLVTLLLAAEKSGICTWSTYVDGVLHASKKTTATVADAAALATNGRFAIGGELPSSQVAPKSGTTISVHDYRFWTDLASVPDATDAAFAAHFIDLADGGKSVSPTVANAVYGQPKIWLPTDPEQVAALRNLGSAGDFTASAGTFE